MTTPILVRFAAGVAGPSRIDGIAPVSGEGLPAAERLAVLEGVDSSVPAGAVWLLQGVTSNVRYGTRAELVALAARQKPLGRPEATRAALIPIRKSDAWWDLPGRAAGHPPRALPPHQPRARVPAGGGEASAPREGLR